MSNQTIESLDHKVDNKFARYWHGSKEDLVFHQLDQKLLRAITHTWSPMVWANALDSLQVSTTDW